MISQEQLIERIDARMPKDPFGFEWHEYMDYLEPARMKKYLKPDATTDDLPAAKPIDRTAILARMKEYMPFAFEKAHGERGLSANRSIAHYVAWTWLAGDTDFSADLQRGRDYEPYGLPMLRRICEFYGWDPKEHGDDR